MKVTRAKQVIPVMDTLPEKIVQGVLRGLGVPFKSHVPINIGYFHQVDILLVDSLDVLEVEGCFFHQCELCGHSEGYGGETAEEIREYDRVRDERLKEKGFNVHRVWEHETQDISVLTVRLKQISNVGILQVA